MMGVVLLKVYAHHETFFNSHIDLPLSSRQGNACWLFPFSVKKR